MFKLKFKLSTGEVIDTVFYVTMDMIEINKDRDNRVYLNNSKTFEYKGEIINVDNFEYIPLDDYIAQLDQVEYMADLKKHTLEDFIAMLLKESDRVGFIVPVTPNPFGINNLLASYEFNTGKLPVLMRPSFKRFPKEHLADKIELIPASNKFSVISPCQLFTIRDFFDRVELGHIRMVNLETFYSEEKE